MLVSLGEHCDFLGGFAFKSQDLKESDGIPVIKIKNVNGRVVSLNDVQFFSVEKMSKKLERFLLADGDVLIAMTGQGSVGRVGRFRNINNRKVLLNQRVGKFLPKESLDLGYLYYILSSEKFEKTLFNAASGSGQPNLSPDIIKSIKIPYLPKNEQIYVAEVLGKLDEKIELNKQTNNTLEQMAQALFKSWFIDFDPVVDNALVAGNPIPDELAHRVEVRKKAHALADFQPLPEHIRNLFPSEFEQTGESTVGIDGWTPKGWHVSTTKDEFDIRGGATPSTKNEDFWGGDIHWTSPKDLSGNNTKVLLDTARKITEQGVARISSGLLPKNTVLMSSRAPVGYLALARVPVAINQGYIALICNKRVSPEYAIYFLESRMDEIKGISGGTTFAEISKKTFKEIKILVPNNTDLIESFSANVRDFFSRVEENERMTSTLSLLRNRLLPRLVSGEIKLDSTEQSSNQEAELQGV